jgi:hypothetical protein
MRRAGETPAVQETLGAQQAPGDCVLFGTDGSNLRMLLLLVGVLVPLWLAATANLNHMF